MASPLRLTLCPPDPTPGDWAGAADEAWTAVRDEFEAAEQALSKFRATSDLTRLNATAGRAAMPVRDDRRLERALIAADRAWRLTGGFFDPRILEDMERIGEHGATVPSRPSTDPASSPDASSPRVVRRSADGAVICIDRPIDLGGIGKGLALRWAATILRRRGVHAYLLDAGGDLIADVPGPDGGPWLVGIEDPTGGPDAMAAITLRAGAVATSSIRRRRWQQGDRTVHHLLDPRTGEPADGGLLAVTVAATDPAWAEVWSKTLFVLGRREIATAARHRSLAAWWIAEDGSLEMTPAARVMTSWVASEPWAGAD
jgi:thiamine biosynthesis lipoprotein